jgi:hypothetical protein
MDLKTYWSFLQATDTAWDRVTLVGRFTAWLRQPAGETRDVRVRRP